MWERISPPVTRNSLLIVHRFLKREIKGIKVLEANLDINTNDKGRTVRHVGHSIILLCYFFSWHDHCEIHVVDTWWSLRIKDYLQGFEVPLILSSARAPLHGFVGCKLCYLVGKTAKLPSLVCISWSWPEIFCLSHCCSLVETWRFSDGEERLRREEEVVRLFTYWRQI